MTHRPGSSEHSAVEGKLSRIAFHGTIDRNHPACSFTDATDRRARLSLRLFAALIFTALLALAPHPAFAQHGGGGGGHGGGGGFGGSHGGGFGGGGGARGGGGSMPHGGSSSGNAAGSSGGATNSAAHSAASSRFIGGSTWQAPPSAAMRGGAQPSTHFISADEAAASGARVVARPVEPRGISNPLGASTALRGSSFTNGATSNAIRTRPYAAQFVGAPPHVPSFPIRYPIFYPGFGFGGCFGPYFFGCGGGFYGGGFGGFYGGFGFGLGYGYGYCDPFWGCPAGFGSYYNGGYYGNQIYNDSTSDSSVSSEFNPSRYWGPSAPPEETSGGGGSASSSDNEVVLFLKDGTVYAITDYWIADNKLHYITNYGGENSISLDQLDMQRTVDVNAKRGINITLRPTPQSQQPTAPDAQPAPDAPPAPEAAPPPQSAPPPPPSAPPTSQSAPAPNAPPDAQPPANPPAPHSTPTSDASPY
jgi:hypothetical protein